MRSLVRAGLAALFAAAVVVAGAAAAGASSPATAAGRTWHRIRPMPPLTFPCPQGFEARIVPVRFDVWETSSALRNGDVATFDKGPDHVRVTNKSTGVSVVENVSGPTLEVQRPNGSFLLVSGGRTMILLTPAQARAVGQPALAGINVIAGRTESTFDSSLTLTSLRYSGQVTDVCALLS